MSVRIARKKKQSSGTEFQNIAARDKKLLEQIYLQYLGIETVTRETATVGREQVRGREPKSESAVKQVRFFAVEAT